MGQTERGTTRHVWCGAFLTFAATVALGTGCGRKAPVAAGVDPRSATRQPAPTQPRSAASRSVYEIAYAQVPGLSRNPHWFKLTLRNTGQATYLSDGHDEPSGTFEGSVPVRDYDRLAEEVLNQGFLRCGWTYGPMADDATSRFVSVVYNGKRKTVEDFGAADPNDKDAPRRALVSIEKEMEAIIAKTKWVKKKDTSDTGWPPFDLNTMWGSEVDEMIRREDEKRSEAMGR